MTGVRIACPSCHGGNVGHTYGVRMSDGSTGEATVVTGCSACKGTGWIRHPGKFKAVSERGRGDRYEEFGDDR